MYKSIFLILLLLSKVNGSVLVQDSSIHAQGMSGAYTALAEGTEDKFQNYATYDKRGKFVMGAVSLNKVSGKSYSAAGSALTGTVPQVWQGKPLFDNANYSFSLIESYNIYNIYDNSYEQFTIFAPLMISFNLLKQSSYSNIDLTVGAGISGIANGIGLKSKIRLNNRHHISFGFNYNKFNLNSYFWEHNSTMDTIEDKSIGIAYRIGTAMGLYTISYDFENEKITPRDLLNNKYEITTDAIGIEFSTTSLSLRSGYSKSSSNGDISMKNYSAGFSYRYKLSETTPAEFSMFIANKLINNHQDSFSENSVGFSITGFL